MATITRRVYDSQNVLIREGLVPDTVPNTRADLLAWWQEQDLLTAREAALSALAPSDVPAGPDPALLADQIAETSDRLRLLQARLSSVEEQRLLDPDGATKLATDLARAQLAPATISALVDSATASLEGTATAARDDLTQLRAMVEEASVELDLLRAHTTTALAEAIAGQQAEAAQQRVRELNLLAERAKDIRGPQGDTGAPGPGMGITSGTPSGQEATTAALGRPAIAGDLLIDGSDELRPAYRFDGEGWERGPSMAGPTKVVPTSMVVSSNTSTTFAAGAAGAANASNSAGAEAFIPQVVTGKGGPSIVWNSSRWAGGVPAQEVHSALLYVAVVNTKTGLHGSAMVNISGQGTIGFDVTTFAEIGEFAGAARLNVTAQMGTATPPPGGALAAGTPNAMSIFVGVTGPDSYAVSGWVLPALKQAPGGKQPQPGW